MTAQPKIKTLSPWKQVARAGQDIKSMKSIHMETYNLSSSNRRCSTLIQTIEELVMVSSISPQRRSESVTAQEPIPTTENWTTTLY